MPDDPSQTGVRGVFRGFFPHVLAFLRRRENWYRDVWLGLVSIFVLLSLYTQNGVVEKVQDGRRLGTNITCSATSAVIEAGRTTLQNSATFKPRELELNLEKLGLPPAKARQIAADHAAEMYAQHISNAVAAEAGPTGQRVVRKDGTLDCDALRDAVGAN